MTMLLYSPTCMAFMTASLFAAPTVGCSEAQSAKNEAPGIAVVMRQDTLLAVAASDSVMIRVDSGQRWLEWTRTDEGERQLLYRSGVLDEGTLGVRLLDANDDGIPDLFIQWWFEEQVSGMLRIGGAHSESKIAYTSPLGLCRPPLIADVDGDGVVEIVERWPGAVTLADCVEGGGFETCVDAFAVEWQVPLFAAAQGASYAPDSARSKTFFNSRARVYRETLVALQSGEESSNKTKCAPLVRAIESLYARTQRGELGRP